MSDVGAGESQFNGSQDMTQMNDPDGLIHGNGKMAYDEENDPRYQLYRNEYIEHQDLPSRRRRGRPGYAQRE